MIIIKYTVTDLLIEEVRELGKINISYIKIRNSIGI